MSSYRRPSASPWRRPTASATEKRASSRCPWRLSRNRRASSGANGWMLERRRRGGSTSDATFRSMSSQRRASSSAVRRTWFFSTMQKFGLSKEDRAAGRGFPLATCRHRWQGSHCVHEPPHLYDAITNLRPEWHSDDHTSYQASHTFTSSDCWRSCTGR